jgi:hypothetical protein
VSFVLFAATALALLAAGCGDDPHPNAWCRLATKGNMVFDTRSVFDADAQREFRRIEAEAPAAIRDDVRTARLGALDFQSGADRFADAKYRARFLDAVKRVNEYLHDECGVDVTPRTDAGTGGGT